MPARSPRAGVAFLITVAGAGCLVIGTLGSTIAAAELSRTEQVCGVAAPFALVVGCVVRLFFRIALVLVPGAGAYAADEAASRDAVRSGWTTSGVVGALALGCIASLIQSDPSDAGFQTLHHLWYVLLLWFAVGWSLIAVSIASIALFYTDALDGRATRSFLEAHPQAVSIPISAICVCFLLTCVAVNVWIYEAAGLVVGLVGNSLWPFAVGFVALKWSDFATWVADHGGESSLDDSGPTPSAESLILRQEGGSATAVVHPSADPSGSTSETPPNPKGG